MLADRPGLAAAEQSNRPAGEDGAIAFQIIRPGLVVDFVREDLADIDRGRMHRIDEQGDSAGESLAVLLALFLAVVLDMLLERARGLAKREHLAGQPLGCGARRLDGPGGNRLDP